MGVSFRVSKTGKRFRPRPIPRSEEPSVKENVDSFKEGSFVPSVNGSQPLACNADAADKTSGLLEHDVSFALNLFPCGYFIGKTNELLNQEASKRLLPYNRASEPLFSAIETGWLPGVILDDIPSKFTNGFLICEVRDYRKCTSEQGLSGLSMDSTPSIKRIRLHMSLEHIVKDIPSISDDSWTYRDLLEVESRILKAVQPNLVLDPTPMMDRLCQNPVNNQLDLGMSDLRKKRPRPTPEVTITSNSQTHGKIFIDRLPESMNPNTPMNPNLPSHQSIVNSFGKRENDDSRLLPQHSASRRPKVEGITLPQPQQVSSPLESFNGTEMQWKNPILMGGGGSYLNQPGIRFGIKDGKTEPEGCYNPEKLKNDILQLPEKEGLLLEPFQYTHPILSRGHFPPHPQPWHLAENKKADSIQKTKATLSPRVSTGLMAHSPVSSKSGELSSGSMGSAMGAQREKSTLTSNGNPFKRKPNPPLKNHMAGSPASAGNAGAPLTAPATSEQTVFDTFSKIESIAQRYQLNFKKSGKVKMIPPQKLKPPTSHNIANYLSNAFTNEDYSDSMGPMARSLLNGTVNTARMRVLTFARHEHIYQGLPVPSTGSVQDFTKVTMRESPTDGTVIMHYGPIDESDPQASHCCPLVLPNTHCADLLAAQLQRLMERDRYQLKEDQIQPLPPNLVNNSDSFGTTFGQSESVGPAIQQRTSIASSAGQGGMGLPSPSQSFQAMTRPMTPGTLPGIQASFLPGRVSNLPLPSSQIAQPAAHMDQIAPQQPQPQQLPPGQTQMVQMQKSMPMMGANSLSRLMGQSSGMPMAGSKAGHLQMQMMQQHHHSQIPPGKPMMGMGGIMGMGTGIRSMPGQMNLGPATGFGSGVQATMSPVQMTALRLRMAQQQQQQQQQNRGTPAVAGMYGGSQAGIMNGQMLASSPAGLSMLGQSLNRATMSTLQRTTMSSMGPPKAGVPANFYLNQQQQQQQQQQLMAQQQQQQQMGSPMQQMQVGSPVVIGSPSRIAVQQISQQTPASPQQINSVGVAPASPQLSSQTVGSITSSPMEQLQSTNKMSSGTTL